MYEWMDGVLYTRGKREQVSDGKVVKQVLQTSLFDFTVQVLLSITIKEVPLYKVFIRFVCVRRGFCWKERERIVSIIDPSVACVYLAVSAFVLRPLPEGPIRADRQRAPTDKC